MPNESGMEYGGHYQPEDKSAQRPSHCYPQLEMQYRMERELREQSRSIERLWELSHHDPAVKLYLEAWRAGHFRSFEDMIVQLAVQLASDKAEYMKTAVKMIQSTPPASVILKTEIYESLKGTT